MRAIFGRGIHPLQAILDNINNTTQNFTVIGSTNAPFLWKEWFDLFNLFFGKPKQA